MHESGLPSWESTWSHKSALEIDESALGYMRVHLDHGSALEYMSELGSWECTGMHDLSALG